MKKITMDQVYKAVRHIEDEYEGDDFSFYVLQYIGPDETQNIIAGFRLNEFADALNKVISDEKKDEIL